MPKRVGIPLTKRVIEAARPGTMLWDLGLPGFGLRITPAGARSFIVQYRTAGGTQARRTVGGYRDMSIDAARVRARPILALAKAERRAAAKPVLGARAPVHRPPEPAAAPDNEETAMGRHARRLLAALLEDIERCRAAGALEAMTRNFPSVFAVLASDEPRPFAPPAHGTSPALEGLSKVPPGGATSR